MIISNLLINKLTKNEGAIHPDAKHPTDLNNKQITSFLIDDNEIYLKYDNYYANYISSNYDGILLLILPIAMKNNENIFIKGTLSYKLFFNITVQAMNLPNVDKLVTKLQETWNGKYDVHKLTKPSYLAVNCLKPKVVERVLHDTKVFELNSFYKDYKFDSKLNQRMQSFLLDLDAKRGTDSRKIIPWCFE